MADSETVPANSMDPKDMDRLHHTVIEETGFDQGETAPQEVVTALEWDLRQNVSVVPQRVRTGTRRLVLVPCSSARTPRSVNDDGQEASVEDDSSPLATVPVEGDPSDMG